MVWMMLIGLCIATFEFEVARQLRRIHRDLADLAGRQRDWRLVHGEEQAAIAGAVADVQKQLDDLYRLELARAAREIMTMRVFAYSNTLTPEGLKHISDAASPKVAMDVAEAIKRTGKPATTPAAEDGKQN